MFVGIICIELYLLRDKLAIGSAAQHACNHIEIVARLSLQVVDVFRAIEHHYGINFFLDDLICEHLSVSLDCIF